MWSQAHSDIQKYVANRKCEYASCVAYISGVKIISDQLHIRKWTQNIS